MEKSKYKLEYTHDRWVNIFILVNNTHYEWVKCVCDMDTAKRYIGA